MTSGHDHSSGSLINRLELLARCPLCASAFEQQEIRLVRQTDTGQTLHLSCPSCHASLLAMVVPSRTGMSLVGAVTDLSHADAKKVLFQEHISDEELLSWHATLARDGAFEKQIISQKNDYNA